MHGDAVEEAQRLGRYRDVAARPRASGEWAAL